MSDSEQGTAASGPVPGPEPVPTADERTMATLAHLLQLVGWQVHHALDAKFGRNWDARTGAYLREKFFSRGGLLTLDQIMQEGTGEPLNPQYMIESLKAPER